MAAGDLYLETVRFLTRLAPGPVRAAAQEWAGYAGILDEVDSGLKNAARFLHGSGLVGELGTSLFGAATDTLRALTQVRAALGPGPLSLTGAKSTNLDGSTVDLGGSLTPARILSWLADELQSAKATAAEFAASHPLPAVPHHAPDAGDEMEEARTTLDEVAEEWLYRLLPVVRAAMDAMWQVSLDWPAAADLQQADPSVGQPAAGVVAAPR